VLLDELVLLLAHLRQLVVEAVLHVDAQRDLVGDILGPAVPGPACRAVLDEVNVQRRVLEPRRRPLRRWRAAERVEGVGQPVGVHAVHVAQLRREREEVLLLELLLPLLPDARHHEERVVARPVGSAHQVEQRGAALLRLGAARHEAVLVAVLARRGAHANLVVLPVLPLLLHLLLRQQQLENRLRVPAARHCAHVGAVIKADSLRAAPELAELAVRLERHELRLVASVVVCQHLRATVVGHPVGGGRA
jgi:hypothetical protein